MRVAQKFAGYSLAEADNLRKAMGKKSARSWPRPARRSSRGAATTGYDDARQAAVRHHRAVRRLRVQQEPQLRLRPRHLPDGVPQGALPGRVLRLPADERQEQPRQGGRVPVRVPLGGHQGAHPRHQPVGASTSPRSRADRGARRRRRCRSAARARSRSGCRPCATSAKALVELLLAERDRERCVHLVPRLRRAGARAGAQQADGRVADQGRRVRLGSAIRAAACSASFEQIIDITVDRRRERDRGVMSLFGDWGDDARRRHGRRASTSARRSPTSSSTRASACKAEKEMLGLYVSDHPLFGVEAALSARSSTVIADLAELERRRPGARRRRRSPVWPGSSRSGRPDGRVRARGPRGLDRGDGVPAHAAGAGPQARGRRDRRRQGPARQARRVAVRPDLPGRRGALGAQRGPGAAAAAAHCPATPSTS